MPKSQSPVFQFLTEKENLPAVLQVVRYAEEIREYVAGRFWDALKEAIKKSQPKVVSTSFRWECGGRLRDKSNGCFNLFGIPGSISEKGQHLEYAIEAHLEYFGMGLAWNEDPHRQAEELHQIESVKALEAVLRGRQGEWYQKDRSWLWWETWERDPYTPYTDPWSWFGSDFPAEWFDDKAKKFWDFVVLTHRLVLDANKALSGSRS